jgi:Carboxypeptidase regulatory-like domain
MFWKRCFWVFLPAFALLMNAPSLAAQSASTALISGAVTDPSGAIVVGASVTLVDHGTGVAQVAKTGKDGRYVFPAVNPGDYSLNFTAQGFTTTIVNELHVEVQKNYTVNMSLTLGSTSQTVSVSEASNAAELQTTTATVGEVLGGASLEALPEYTRSASALMFYQPAVSPGGQIAGARDEQITFSLDGGDVTSDLEGNNTYAAPPGEPSPSPVVPIPIESTEEFEVATTNPNSTFARSSGGQVALITKSGTNSFHGSLYEYHNDDALNANGWTNDFLGISKPHNVDNRFGGTIGGPVWKDKVFFFVNYEGRRFYDDTIFNAVVPTPTLKAGILQFQDATGAVDQYSFQPGNITTACGGVSCDPRGIGMSPVIQSQLALYRAGNNPTLGDGLNTTGDTFDTPTPILEDIGVARLDYKISKKWTSFATLHTADIRRVGTEQFSLLNDQSVAKDPIRPWYVTYQLTGQLTPTLTSVTHGSYLYDWWGWTRINPAPLVSGTEQALSLAGEGTGTSNSTSKLIADPVVIATQSARSRFYDGHKTYIGQDFSWTKGTQVLQFGGSGYITHDVFEKTDNYAGGLTTGPIDYIESVGNGSAEYLNIPTSDRPPTCGGSVATDCLTSANVLRYNELYASVLGLVDRSSQVLTRNGSFQPNALGTPLISHTLIPAANGYFQDIWQMRKNLVITAGVDWQVQPTPTERNGKNDVLVYAGTNTPVDYQTYFQQRATSLNNGVAPGAAYNPLFGVDPVNSLPQPWTGNVRTTDWHEFGPRISAAWQIDSKTVLRGGYAIVYERIDDIDEISLDLTTGGLLDIDACGGPIASGGSAVCTKGATTPSNAYRIGVDGNSVPVPAPFAAPIPYVPSGTAAQPFGLFMMSGWDPYLHPGHDDSVDWTVQRELPGRMILEVGYIGRFSHNLFNELSYNAADYLMKDAASGQTYAQAFDGVAVPLRGGVKPSVTSSNGVVTGANPQFPDEPFFDNQIGLANCTSQAFPGTSIAYPNCAAMVATQDPTDLINGSLNDFSLDELNRVTPTPIDDIQTFESFAISDRGFSNYNAGFLSLKKSFSQGLQFQFNWTWSHAIGNQGVDQQSGSTSNSPYNLNLDKSSESFDRRHVVTAWFYGELPVGRGRRFNVENPALDKVIGGWYTSGVFNFVTGLPLYISADGDYGDWESKGTAAICTAPLNNLYGQYYNVVGSGGVATSGNPANHGTGANLFADPSSVYDSCSRPLLSVNRQIPFDELRMPTNWDLDWSLGKELRLTERYRLTFSAQMFNVFNVVNFNAPSLNLNSPTNFGVFTSQSNTPRRVLLGLRFQF